MLTCRNATPTLHRTRLLHAETLSASDAISLHSNSIIRALHFTRVLPPSRRVVSTKAESHLRIILRKVMARQHLHYVPPPSVGHEIGVMFGFLGMHVSLRLDDTKSRLGCLYVLTMPAFMVVCSLIYGIMWQKGNKRSQLKEAARIEKLRASGLLRGEKDRE